MGKDIERTVMLMQARIIELENQVFVLREALLGAMSYLPGAVGTSDMSTCKSCGTAVTSGSIKYCKKCIWKLANKALKSTAPARWEAMCRVADEARRAVEMAKARCDGSDCEPYKVRGMTCPESPVDMFDDEFIDALAALEGGGE